MNLGIARRFTTAGVFIAAAGSLAVATVTGAAGASHLLTYFKVVLTATRTAGQPPTATVTAAGYERSGTGWRLLAVKRIGQPGQWFWYAVQTCSLDITQYQGVSPVRAFDSVKVSLLATPALGCTQLFSERWKP